jgi:hypothetical protein
MGSQAYGAAQSYTLKLFERSLFQIATGEKGQDVDEHAPVDLPNGNGRKALPARKSSAAAKRDGDWPALKAALTDCQSAREVEKLRTEYRAEKYSAWNQDWRDVADEEFEKRLAEFSTGSSGRRAPIFAASSPPFRSPCSSRCARPARRSWRRCAGQCVPISPRPQPSQHEARAAIPHRAVRGEVHPRAKQRLLAVGRIMLQ